MILIKNSSQKIINKLNKSWKGSYTVEAAFLFPAIMGILVLLLYLAFYLSDLAVLDNLAWKLALEGSLAGTQYSDTQEIEQELYEDVYKRQALKPLPKEYHDIFNYFIPVRGMRQQLETVLENERNCKKRNGTSITGNILITGEPVSYTHLDVYKRQIRTHPYQT